MADDVLSQLAPTGKLRAGVNLSNIHLVTGKSADGAPEGVSPSMGRAVADKLGVDVVYVTYPSPGVVADAVAEDAWDIAMIAADPKRAETIDFTAAYVEIEATYLVREDSRFQTIEDVDQAGVRIAIAARAAYDLYLTRELKHAELVRGTGAGEATRIFLEENCDALASLRPSLVEEAKKIPGTRIIPGKFTAAQQAIGIPKGRPEALAFLKNFVEDAKASGLVAGFIEKHGVGERLSVAPPA